MKILFTSNYVYPTDEVGQYADLTGEVLRVRETADDTLCVEVDTEHGVFGGFTRDITGDSKIRGQAKIRVYRAGGGFYPESRILSWWK